VAGSVVGGILLIGIVAFVIYWFTCRSKPRTAADPVPTYQPPMQDDIHNIRSINADYGKGGQTVVIEPDYGAPGWSATNANDQGTYSGNLGRADM
jgi:hypothetical protein